MAKIRSFIAIELEPGIIDKLKEIQDRLKSVRAEVKWANPSSIHLTLKFLGGIDEGMIEEVAKKAHGVVKKYTPFSLEVGGLGTFPPGRSPRVVWVGVREETGRLSQLQEEIEQEMSNLGFEREQRAFSPHLTLGRVKTPKGREELLKKIGEGKDINLGKFPVKNFYLFRSDLYPQGAVYTKLKSFMLNLS
jgi:2'-5' RNA ligase